LHLDFVQVVFHDMTMLMTMVAKEVPMTLAKNAVKAKLLEYFRYVESTGEDIIVTDHGRPSIRISAIRRGDSVAEVFAAYRGKVRIKGDPLGSTEDEWGLD